MHKNQSKNFAPEKQREKENAPDSARKRRNRVRSGCWRGWGRLETDESGRERPLRARKGRAVPPQLGEDGGTDLSRLPPRSARSLRATGTHSPHDTHCAGRSRASLPSPYAR